MSKIIVEGEDLMKKKPILKQQMNQQYYFYLAYPYFDADCILYRIIQILDGMITILFSPSQLFTDCHTNCFSVGNTLLNMAIMLLINIYSYKQLEIPVNGTVIGSLEITPDSHF